MKKLLALVLSIGIIFGSYANVAAAELPQIEKTSVISSTRASTQIDQTKFTTARPGVVMQNGFSASVIFNSFSAQRQSDGSVKVIINESFHSVRGYYEHLATDSSGENFIPNKNTAYHTNSEGIYSITLPSNSVSSDGYVYIRFGFDPVGAPPGQEHIIDMQQFKIPVDYDTYKVVNSNYKTLSPGEQYTGVFSAQLAVFDAKATRLSDNTVEVLINIDNCNTSLWFNHLATSKDGDIFIPQKDTWYFLGDDIQNNKSYRFVLPEKNVSSDGYVYLNVSFNLPFGMYNVGKIKLNIS
ncbi:MAG: hypothetical protein ACLR9T_07985 [Thomasclavelia sp.]|uniref:hypothetical protein n=1 Tax=Thomasclavelia sp. TaxID=3025757 RepID=UPI00399F1E85